jgi:nucleotide-binding universal stress UspA family protein
MAIRKILVATDFSADAERACEVALDMARPLGASLVLLHVVQVPTYALFDGSTYIPSAETVAGFISDAAPSTPKSRWE